MESSGLADSKTVPDFETWLVGVIEETKYATYENYCMFRCILIFMLDKAKTTMFIHSWACFYSSVSLLWV